MRESFFVLLAEVKRMVTLLPEPLLLAIGAWVSDAIQFGRSPPKLRVVGPEVAAPRAAPAGAPWEVMGLIRRHVHDLDEDSVVFLRTWCVDGLRFA